MNDVDFSDIKKEYEDACIRCLARSAGIPEEKLRAYYEEQREYYRREREHKERIEETGNEINTFLKKLIDEEKERIIGKGDVLI